MLFDSINTLISKEEPLIKCGCNLSCKPFLTGTDNLSWVTVGIEHRSTRFKSTEPQLLLKYSSSGGLSNRLDKLIGLNLKPRLEQRPIILKHTGMSLTG